MQVRFVDMLGFDSVLELPEGSTAGQMRTYIMESALYNMTRTDMFRNGKMLEGGEKFFNVAVAVDKRGVDQQQQRHGGANAGGNGENGLLMFSSVESHYRQHENEQGAKMKRQMI